MSGRMSFRGANPGDLYDVQRIKRLFDEMAGTYGIVNTLSSFGFNWRWRKQCLAAISPKSGQSALDLMTGMGELCPDLSRILGPEGRITAVDLSQVMCRKARAVRCECPLSVIEADVLEHPFEPASADVIVSSFGLKTFSAEQTRRLAEVVATTLKPGGVFSFVEISVPPNPVLRWPYMFYLNHVVPWVGLLLLGNPDNYRQLGIYTSAFGDCRQAADAFAAQGLEVRPHSLFYGCATGFTGRRVA